MLVTRATLVLSLLTLCLCSALSAQQARIESMKLLTPEFGWAATLNQVSLTTDSGHHWKEITPPLGTKSEIASVFFLDESEGWVLLARRAQVTDEVAGFALASTSNAGASWAILPVKIPGLSPQAQLPGDARMDFLDPLHGWINFGGGGSAAMNAGFLVATADGGRTWNDVRGGSEFQAGGSGPVLFTSLKDGWFTNGVELFVSHDGASTWQAVSLKAPPEAGPAVRASYELPTFGEAGHGFLQVTYSGPSAPSALALFRTNDSGRTWVFDRILPNLRETGYGQTIPSTMAAGTLVAAAESGPGHVAVVRVPAGGAVNVLGEVSSGISEFSFAGNLQGWALNGVGQLLLTTDGGSTWVEITPRAGTRRTRSEESRPLGPESSGEGAAPLAGAAINSAHTGFDQQFVATPSQMGTWWASSPYYDAAFYLNGGHNHTTDPNLNQGWVTSALNQGWGLVPAWVDLQAPCACKYGQGTYPNCTQGTYSSVISTNPTTAQQQGVTSADAAAQAAGGLGVTGAIIYADIEQYDIPSTLTSCGPAVVAFLNGWISEVQNKGYLGGVYGAPADAANWKANLAVLPEDVWIAKYDNRVTIWGLQHGLTDSMWNINQRIHQYRGTHSETWGSLKLPKIDNDIEDAGIVGGKWAKTHTFSFTSFDCGVATFPGAIGGVTSSGQVGEVVGYYEDAGGGYHGFSYSGGPCTSIDYSGAMRTLATGINSAGQIVGMYMDQSSLWHGFLNGGAVINYPGALNTYATGINDDGQVIGYYEDTAGNFHGFLQSAGKFYSFDYVGAVGLTTVRGINGITQAVGWYWPSLTGSPQGFGAQLTPSQGPPLEWTAGSFGSISYPGSSIVYAMGMNNNGQAVGYYYNPNGPFAFLYDSNTSTYSTISNSGRFSLELGGINDAGQMVGSYEDSQAAWHGFIAAPQ
jgi:probable HAF family extracellular repeat protein